MFTNGRHPYHGKYNSSGQRKRSKLYKGVKVNFRELGRAFEAIEQERLTQKTPATMSQKQEKRLRKELQMKHREEIKAYRAKAEAIAKRDMNMFRPKPRWIPMALWVWILGFFVKIKK